jgi:hypothetical protein
MLKRRRNGLPEEVGPDADPLLGLRGELAGCIKDASGGGFGVVKTRCHGDYHLGQVLVVGNDFQIIDFEATRPRPSPSDAGSTRLYATWPGCSYRSATPSVGPDGPGSRARRAFEQTRAVGQTLGATHEAGLPGWVSRGRVRGRFLSRERGTREGPDRTDLTRETSSGRGVIYATTALYR